MEAILQFNLEHKNGTSVPSPYDNTGDIWWWDRGATDAQQWSRNGITHVLTPPVTKGGSMGGGYDPYNHYDIGSPNPTRFGSREKLHRFAAIMKANNIGILMDNVLAHMDGGKQNGYVYDYSKFPKDRTCFVDYPEVPKDDVAAPDGDFASVFGRQIAYQHGYFGDGDTGYMLRGMTDALEWQYRALQVAGGRLDNAKSMAPGVVDYINTHGATAGKFLVGEFYDGNVDTLLWWIFNSGCHGRVSAFDFNIYFSLRDMANGTGHFDMRRLQNAGLFKRAPFNAVTFIENHDTATSYDPVIYNKELGAAFIALCEGTPCFYFQDMDADVGYGLWKPTANLLWCRLMFAQGMTAWCYADYNLAAFERLGYLESPGCVAVYNNDSFGPGRWVTMHTHFRNSHLHDYTGHAPDVWTDQHGTGSFYFPQNVNGSGYACYAPNGYQGAKVTRIGGSTTQRFQGAADLDIPQATLTGSKVMRIWCAPGTTISITPPRNGVLFDITDPTGKKVANKALSGKVVSRGYHAITAFSPTEAPLDYSVDVTYTATKDLLRSECDL